MWDSYETIYKVTKSQVSRQIHKYKYLNTCEKRGKVTKGPG